MHVLEIVLRNIWSLLLCYFIGFLFEVLYDGAVNCFVIIAENKIVPNVKVPATSMLILKVKNISIVLIASL